MNFIYLLKRLCRSIKRTVFVLFLALIISALTHTIALGKIQLSDPMQFSVVVKLQGKWKCCSVNTAGEHCSVKEFTIELTNAYHDL